MTNESKPFASLSSGLLARRGEAKPAMRRQAVDLSHAALGQQGLEDLGWNDMGVDEHHEPTRLTGLTGMTPVQPQTPPVVVEQQRELEREFSTPKPARAPRAAPGSKGKAAFTLRLDPDRHLQLRLACAVTHRSAQQIVTQALDEFLARQPSVADLAITGDRSE
jgi:hypothetical protein